MATWQFLSNWPIYPTLPGLTFPIKRTPMFQTLRQMTLSGRERTYAQWSYPRRHYELAYDFLKHNTDNQQQTLESLYNYCMFSMSQPNGGTFLFYDPDDNACTNAFLGAGTGSQTVFQAIRYIFGMNYSFGEPVFIITSMTAAYVNGTSVSATANSPRFGKITFASPPANGTTVTWTGTYAWLCRFDDDSQEHDKFMSNLYSAQKVAFTTVKV